jgi:hypothetical protein
MRLCLKLKSQRGAMDKILVTLLFVVVGVASLVLVNTWFDGKRDMLLDESNTQVNRVMNEVG